MNNTKQETASTHKRGQEVVCAWPGCESRMSLDAQQLLEQYVRSKPTKDAMFVLGNHPDTDWLFVYGKGCFCERHWFLDPDDDHCELGPREES
ncbi:hypothetical protein [Bifidobacterium asteroides]|uniref:hypothetical protein n=1 Tax=Bifidobacterium asteroides TaxID=1684 RepID=UPI003A8133AE